VIAMSELKNINLIVSSFALKNVQSVINKSYKNDYKSLVKKMPTYIQKNGFINTLVFCYSKNNKKHFEKILNTIIEWNKHNPKINNILSIKNEDFKVSDESSYRKYIELLAGENLTPSQYRLITKEMMELFGWIKRFSEGMIE
jgi:CRISPR-associated protein Cmr5